MTRRFLVFDGDGELVATFADWEDAHAWAHQRSTEPLASRPVQVEDRLGRRTWTVEADTCRLTVWRRRVEYRCCPVDRRPADAAGGGVDARRPAWVS